MSKVDWIIHYVIPEEDDMEGMIDCHTHGLDAHNHPELMCVLALPQEVCADLINSLGLRILEGERFDEERIYTNIIANDLPVKVIRTKVGNNDMAVLIFPDQNGLLPEDSDCADVYNEQEIFLEEIKKRYN